MPQASCVIFGEAMGGMKISQLCKEAKLSGVKAAVQKHLSR